MLKLLLNFHWINCLPELVRNRFIINRRSITFVKHIGNPQVSVRLVNLGSRQQFIYFFKIEVLGLIIDNTVNHYKVFVHSDHVQRRATLTGSLNC